MSYCSKCGRDPEEQLDILRIEIERLRAANEWLRDDKACALSDMKEEIERLRAALKALDAGSADRPPQ